MSYEERIKRRRLENQEVLKKLGIFSVSQDANIQRPVVTQSPKTNIKRSSVASSHTSTPSPSRRSIRLLGKEPIKYSDDIQEDPQIIIAPQRQKEKRPNTFGAIEGVSVGTVFLTRMEASHAGIHRPTVAGIHGNPAIGCYSLALSGGYEDDVDLGDSFVYTGEGGRDLKGTKTKPKNLRTAPQSKDQVLERGNLALSKNIENNLPVRVLRGYKLRSTYAPNEGYRYDGLYNVVEYYISKGLSGFSVYKFRLERIQNQEPAPWAEHFLKNENSSPEKENMTKDGA